jgi:hypothetical protein
MFEASDTLSNTNLLSYLYPDAALLAIPLDAPGRPVREHLSACRACCQPIQPRLGRRQRPGSRRAQHACQVIVARVGAGHMQAPATAAVTWLLGGVGETNAIPTLSRPGRGSASIGRTVTVRDADDGPDFAGLRHPRS